MDNVFIVIPGLNEEKHIESVIRRTRKAGFKEIIFVDDGSKDKSAEIAEKAGASVLTHAVNLGKGAAAKTGCDYALQENADVIVLMDADGQHNPEDIPRLLKALKGKDIVFSYRTLNKEMPFVYRFGNWFINKSTETLFRIRLRDTQCGFRAMTRNAYRKIRWESIDYTMESEMISLSGKHKLKYKEIPIKTIYHDKYKGTSVLDGVKIFLNMVKFRVLR